jgi:AhpD family alkylhydroperoxidase
MRAPGRRYRNWREPVQDVRFLVQQHAVLWKVVFGRGLNPVFRERLMLVVTAVNACRYCARLHLHLARRSGLPPEEATLLLSGEPGPAPAEEIPALLYAQDWAEHDAHPDPEVRRAMMQGYGVEAAAAIEVTLRLIRVGNLAGNTIDALLHRVARGRVGGG